MTVHYHLSEKWKNILKLKKDIWQLVILSIIMAIGIPSNIIIIFVSTYFRKSMPPSSILVTNLAISGDDAKTSVTNWLHRCW